MTNYRHSQSRQTQLFRYDFQVKLKNTIAFSFCFNLYERTSFCASHFLTINKIKLIAQTNCERIVVITYRYQTFKERLIKSLDNFVSKHS